MTLKRNVIFYIDDTVKIIIQLLQESKENSRNIMSMIFIKLEMTTESQLRR